MAYKTCPDCGSRIFEHGCVNCNEVDYISMQQEYSSLKNSTMNTTPRKYYEGCADLGGTSNEEYKLDNGLGTATVYSTTPSDKKLTPMAKVLKWVDEKYPNFNKADIEEYITSLLPEEREMVEMAWDDAYATGCVVGANDYTNEQDEDTGFNYFTNNYQQ